MTTHSKRDDVRYPRQFWLVLGAGFLFFFCFHLLLTTLPLYIQDLGATEAQIGFIMGLFAVASILARIVVGRVVDGWGRKPALLIGAGIFASAPLMYLAARSLWAILGVRVFHGLGMAFFITAYLALVTDMAPQSRRGEAIGLAGMASSLALLSAPATGMHLLQETGFRGIFVVSSGFGMLSLVTISLIRDRFRARLEDSPSLSLKAVVAKRAIVFPSLLIIVMATGFGATITFLPLLTVRRSVSGIGYFFTAYAISNLLGQPLAGRMSDTLGRRRVILPGFLLISISLFIIGRIHSSVVLLGAAVIYGLAMGLARPSLDATLADAAPSEARGTVMGFGSGCFDLGMGLGSLGLGFVAAVWGYEVMYSGVALLTLVAASMLVLIPSREVRAS